MQWRVRVEVPLKATEDESKILELVNSIIDPDRVYIEEEAGEKHIVALARCISSLNKLRQMLRRERILDAARKRMLSKASKDRLIILIHKQALASKRLSLVDDERESPLGPVLVEILHEKPREIVDWLAPPTSRGRPLWERGLPENECAEG